MGDHMKNLRSTIILPSCAYPNNDPSPEREIALRENIRHIQGFLPDRRIIVADNGTHAPDLCTDVTLFHDPLAFSKDPSIGECRNLVNALQSIEHSSNVIKLHARCKLSNTQAFRTFLRDNGEFLLVNRNIWARSSNRYGVLPFIDTRVFAVRADRLRRLIEITLATLEADGGQFEQAMLSAVMRSPADCSITFARGPFFPIFEGQSGHGRNYSSATARMRSHTKACIFRLGL